MEDDRFSWYDPKAALNPLNHKGVTFVQARAVFEDPFAEDVLDDRFDYEGEERWNITGLDVSGSVLVVTYTIRAQRYHIISARKANRHERSAYYAQRS
jgi:uncharacterized DUF497 family protein